ncbi:hypothetical protein SAMD00019534_053950, partial [Acytostelium subglobosum LB1]|uniref:hypothetical protein n=1 Tax=Acytostelium subglobosum LB1 TaxID=1410327 RepID=UPI000644EA10
MSQSEVLDVFVGNEEISGTILEKFRDQSPDKVRVAFVTMINSFTKMITIRVNNERSYSIYAGYNEGLLRVGGLSYSFVQFPIDPDQPNILFSFWKSKELQLLERITDRNYSVNTLKGNTVVISWPNKNNNQYFLDRNNRETPDTLGINNPFN